jgi:DNA-directed RNA polymerase specialized sigma24 family protein
MSKKQESAQEIKIDEILTEAIAENQSSLYTFCYYLLPKEDIEDTILKVLEQFCLKNRHKKTEEELGDLKVFLFQIAWQWVQSRLVGAHFLMNMGRDTRILKEEEERESRKDFQEVFSRIDPSLRAALLLKDLFLFKDEEIATILNLRWGVYRHRLHRARVEVSQWN